VVCQEVGHTFGLDHQDEVFDNANLGTCMDYTNDPDGPPSNLHPNTHDYDELALIYSHSDTTTTVGMPAHGAAGFDDPSEWGRLVSRSENGRLLRFERDFGGGFKVITFVFGA